MPRISEADVARYAIQAGFKDRELVRAVAISFAENRSHDTDAVSPPNRNGTVDVGLWQINSSNAPPEAMKDPGANARKAYELAHNANGWHNWTVFNVGIYSMYLGRADAAVRAAGSSGGSIVGGAGQALQEAVPGAGALTAVGNAVQFLTVGRNWGRIGEIALGSILLIVALNILAKPVTEPIVKTAARGAKLAAL